LPFKGNRGPIILLCIAIFIIIIIAAVASSSGGRKGNPAGLITCTVNGDIGIDKIVITNQNTGKSITKTYADLPYSFNLTEGDTLRLNVTLLDGYAWNAWEINQYPWFAQDNPFTMKVNEAVTLNPQCLVK
jgi:hypothetical protein